MKKSEKKSGKLFELLKILTNKQRKDIKTFVTMSSNHLPEHEEKLVCKLLDEIGRIKNLDETDFAENYFDTKQRSQWEKFKNKFLLVLENYLLIEFMNNNRLLRNTCLVECFANTTAEKNYSSKVNQVRTSLKKNREMKGWHPLIEYRLSEIEVEKSIEARNSADNINLMSQFIDDFYIEHKLRILCEQANRQPILNSKLKDSFLIRLLDKEGIDSLTSESQCYYFAYKLFTTQKQHLFQKVRNFIKLNKDSFSKDFSGTIYIFLLNFCARQINQGVLIYAKYFLAIVDDQIKKKMLIQNGIITGGKFKNCVTNALIANNLKWVNTFISKYERYLTDDAKINMTNYCKALIALFENKIEKSHDYIKSFNTNDLYFNMAYEKLLLKIYYAYLKEGKYNKSTLRENINRLKRNIESQRKLTQSRKKKNVKFLNCFLRLLRGQLHDTDKLLGEIPTADYIWLKKEAS